VIVGVCGVTFVVVVVAVGIGVDVAVEEKVSVD
jgi:hypothetical protein